MIKHRVPENQPYKSKSKTHYIFPSIEIPSTLTFPDHLEARIHELESSLILPALNAWSLFQTLSEDKAATKAISKSLQHYLSPYKPETEKITQSVIRDKLAAEIEVFVAIRPQIQAAIEANSSQHFLAVIRAIGGSFSSEFDFRSCPVRLRPLEDDFVWEFPSASEVEPALSSLHLALCGKSLSPIKKSIICYVAICWIHPFLDGNGRTARVLLNSLLSGDSAPRDWYIPINIFNQVSGSGYFLSLRETTLTGNWEPSAKYIVSILNHCEELSTSI